MGRKRFVIVRSSQAGVFAGELVSFKGTHAVMRNARRLWYWKGAASLSQLAMEGVKCPNGCKFPCEVSRIEITGVAEIIDMTDKAVASVKEVPIWKQ